MHGIISRRQKSTSSSSSKNKKKSKSNNMPRPSKGDFPTAKKVASSNKDQTPGIPHPQTGQSLGPYKTRCACGGVTGVAGTKWGNAKHQSHIQSQQHKEWTANIMSSSTDEN